MLIFSFAPSFFVRLVNVVTKISPIRSVVALVIHPSALQFQVHCSRAFFIAMDHKFYTRFSLTPPISFLLMGGSSRSPWFFPSPVSSHSFPPACVRSSSLFGNWPYETPNNGHRDPGSTSSSQQPSLALIIILSEVPTFLVGIDCFHWVTKPHCCMPKWRLDVWSFFACALYGGNTRYMGKKRVLHMSSVLFFQTALLSLLPFIPSCGSLFIHDGDPQQERDWKSSFLRVCLVSFMCGLVSPCFWFCPSPLQNVSS